MKNTYHYSRRHFIKAAAVSAFAINYFPSRVFGANDRIQFAGIGVGGKGSSDIDQAGNLGDVVAICDIDNQKLQEKKKRFTGAKEYFDYREMLTQMGDKIDAVTVSTPDHTHAPASLMAMKMGKHVYCQKPLTHDIYQARLLRDVARSKKVATQMGNQGTAENGLREAVELIQAGLIGDVTEAHVWTNRPVWPQAPGIIARPKDTPPVPDHVKWDLFLGPAPVRPYHPAYHPFAWRGWWDFGTGALGDMGCHTANMAFMALRLSAPYKVEAQHGDYNPETYPAWATVTSHFKKRGKMGPLKLVWYEGKTPNGKLNLPPADLLFGQVPPSSGSLLVGTKGTLYSPNDYGAAFKLFPEKNFEGYQKPAMTLARNGKGDQGMKAEWVAAMRGGPTPFSNFDYAAALTETILLGNVAIQSGGPIEWNSDKLKVTNNKAANKFIRPDYRPGWMPA